MYPNSHGGRTIATLAALLGITLVALAVDIIHKSMEFSRAEELAYRLVRVRRAKLVLQRRAVEVIQACVRYWREGRRIVAGVQRKSKMQLTNLIEALRGFRAQKQLIANLRGQNDGVVQAMSRQMTQFQESESVRNAELADTVARLEVSNRKQEEVAERTLKQLELLQAMVQELREPLTTTTSI